ncbi:hypothetical protein BX661DRAFT_9397 [Kickxella alabastrina]|uniref:uncharacterized protein n=1 Tax=Kickxella alabastrina TaxID=61397 RepID=UPI00221E6973|nr:uncharacterized protein BX661DRAFT_9397 [Kickxella alabastrina]KAI7834983.1 hypothetical protein BX661DRAFT_9397 [Kickxella alabastrina]
MPAAARPLARKGKPVFEPFEEYNAAAPNNYQTYKTWLQHHKRERRLDRKRQIPIGEPSMCIVLTNMADDIDDSLEAETEEECSAFGRVVHCVATTVDNPGSPFEGVLIYVQFADLDSAARARDALDQRYFDGRHISATFVPLIPSRTAAPS